jgi:hypothetical protein
MPAYGEPLVEGKDSSFSAAAFKDKARFNHPRLLQKQILTGMFHESA